MPVESLRRLVDEQQPVVLDVRSPGEFVQGHIPGAVNLPLLSDAERVEVGKLHRHVGQEAAFERALGRVFPNLAAMLQEVEKICGAEALQGRRQVLVYCKRGGMRSQSVGLLLRHHGCDAHVVEGGYKAFRNWTLAVLRRPQKVCVLGGATGSGKTEVLAELRRLGRQVVDLEALAHHKGSVFGHLGEGPQPSSEHFRGLLAWEWALLDADSFVFLEDEGPRVGTVCLPEELYRRLRAAQLVVRLDVQFELRAERSLLAYGGFGAEALATAVAKFRGHMGGPRTQELLDHLARGELRPVCEAALRNYDRAYEHHLNKARDQDAMVSVAVGSLDSAQAARDVAAAAAPFEARVSAMPDMLSAPPAPQAGTAMATDPPVRAARCQCGAVRISARGSPLSVSICHCTICRRLSGAPFVASALFEPAAVEVHMDDAAPQLWELQTSAKVVRRRCPRCFGPVEASLGARYTALPLALFEWGGAPAPADWQPRHHLHYGSRVMDVADELPKYQGASRGPLWSS